MFTSWMFVFTSWMFVFTDVLFVVWLKVCVY